jgi:hypothetical protein
MEDAAVAAYEAALPDEPRVERKKMFGTPCAFVNRQMFFGTFEGSLVARIGPERVVTLAGRPGMTVFTPTEGRTWADYLRIDPSTDAAAQKSLAAEALAWTSKLPVNAKKPKEARR